MKALALSSIGFVLGLVAFGPGCTTDGEGKSVTDSDCAWNGGECFRKDESTHCSYDGGDDSSYDSSGPCSQADGCRGERPRPQLLLRLSGRENVLI